MGILSAPNIIYDPNYTTKKVLQHLKEDSSVSINTFDADTGEWKSAYWMWGKANGNHVEVKDDRGYLINMKKDKSNWLPVNSL